MTKAIPSGKTTSQSIQITSSKLPQVRPIDIHNYKLKQQKNRKKHSSLAKSLFSDDSLGLLLKSLQGAVVRIEMCNNSKVTGKLISIESNLSCTLENCIIEPISSTSHSDPVKKDVVFIKGVQIRQVELPAECHVPSLLQKQANIIARDIMHNTRQMKTAVKRNNMVEPAEKD